MAASGGPETDSQRIEREALHYLYGFVKPAWKGLALLVLLSALATALGLLQPYLTKILIDDGLIGGSREVLFRVTGAIVAIAVLSFGMGWVSRQLHVGLSARILFAIREAVFAHLTTLSPRFFAARNRGDLLTRLDGDIAEVQRFATDSLLAILNGLFVLFGSLAFMLVLNPKLTAVAFLVIPLQVLFLRMVRPRVETIQRALRERAGHITGFLIDHLSGMKTVQAFNAANRAQGRLMGLNNQYRAELLHQQSLSYVAGGVPGLMLSFATALVFLIGGMWVIDGALQLGTLVAFSAYLARSTGPVQTFLGLYVAWARARVSLGRVWDLARQMPDVVPPDNPVALPDTPRGDICFEGVSFSHAGRDGPILSGLDVHFGAGARVAIVGASGEGKSTLIDLLQRHFDPDQGRITLDGVDLRDVDLDALRRAVVIVSHDAALFPVSIGENIALGLKSVDEGDLKRAGEAARIDQFISGLPDGYRTEIGADGADLSTGQRQRISIARAFLRQPRVLILDEATAAIDDAVAAEIDREIDRLFPQATRIIISHHEVRLGDVDQVYRLEGGRLALVEPVK